MDVMRMMREREYTITGAGRFMTLKRGYQCDCQIAQHAVLGHREAMSRWQWQHKAVAVIRIHVMPSPKKGM
jgi:hypothetical protein